MSGWRGKYEQEEEEGRRKEERQGKEEEIKKVIGKGEGREMKESRREGKEGMSKRVALKQNCSR